MPFLFWLKHVVCGNIQYCQWSVYWLCVVVVCRRKDWLLENTCIFMVRNDVYNIEELDNFNSLSLCTVNYCNDLKIGISFSHGNLHI